jgi:hypothetical protein
VINNELTVFASPFRWVALSSCGYWRDFDLEQGTINGQPILTEQYANAFAKVYKSVGYIYTLSGESFIHDPRLAKFEVISKTAVKPIKVERISNVLGELKILGVTLNCHKDSTKPWWM